MDQSVYNGDDTSTSDEMKRPALMNDRMANHEVIISFIILVSLCVHKKVKGLLCDLYTSVHVSCE